MFELKNLLSSNAYPGRGIIIGKSDDDKSAVIAYFIMGRSENSRNRVFVEAEGGIKTEAYCPEKLVDPSLIIYSPVRVLGDSTIVTNGDQTDTVFDFMKDGKTFEEALRTREFEPDVPNFTPRISGIVKTADEYTYKLSILKSDEGNEKYCNRFFFEYTGMAGVGHFIHTYKCDGNPIPSFEGEPEKVNIDGDINKFAKDVWDNLNFDNKVSLFVRYIDLKTKKCSTIILNKNTEGK